MGPLGSIAAALVALPSLAACAGPEQPQEQKQAIGETCAGIWHEFKTTFLRWRAVPYTLTMLFPMASGALIGLLPGIAEDYRVSGQQMAWMNGIAGALLTASGSLAATLISARIRA